MGFNYATASKALVQGGTNRGPRLTPTERLVWLTLAAYADKDGVCFPAQGTLAKNLDVSRQGVQKALSALEALGAVVILERGYKGRSNRYRVLEPAALPGRWE